MVTARDHRAVTIHDAMTPRKTAETPALPQISADTG
jgi:hypothetical protein